MRMEAILQFTAGEIDGNMYKPGSGTVENCGRRVPPGKIS